MACDRPSTANLDAFVVARAEVADESADRRDVDDVPALTSPHAGEHFAHHRGQPEEIGVEHGADFRLVALFNGPGIAVPCVVDQDVDRPEALDRPGNRLLALLPIANVE
jgi:hypothetical protein